VTRERLTARSAIPDRHWKAVEVVLPVTVPPTQVPAHIDAQLRIIAYEAGDFVEQYRIGLEIARSGGYARWSASYLPGPPGVFPAREGAGRGATSDKQHAQSECGQNYWHLRGG